MPKAIRETARVTLRVTKVSPLRGDSWLNDIKLMKKESYLKEGGYEVLNYFE